MTRTTCRTCITLGIVDQRHNKFDEISHNKCVTSQESLTRQNLVEEHTLAEKARIEREIFESQRCLAGTGSIVVFLRAHHCCF